MPSDLLHLLNDRLKMENAWCSIRKNLHIFVTLGSSDSVTGPLVFPSGMVETPRLQAKQGSPRSAIRDEGPPTEVGGVWKLSLV